MTQHGNAEQRAEFDREVGLVETEPVALVEDDDHPAVRGQQVPDYYRQAGTNLGSFHASLAPS